MKVLSHIRSSGSRRLSNDRGRDTRLENQPSFISHRPRKAFLEGGSN